MKHSRSIMLLVAVMLVTALVLNVPSPTHAAPFFVRWTGWDAPTCSSASGGTFSTGLRHFEWDLPAGAELTIVTDINGSPTPVGPLPAPAGTGSDSYPNLTQTGMGPYPFYVATVFETYIEGVLVHRSTARMDCIADGPATFAITDVEDPPPVEVPMTHYVRWTGWDAPICSAGNGGTFSTGLRRFEFGLPTAAELIIITDVNGSPTPLGPLPAPTGVGSDNYPDLTQTGMGPYPFYIAMVFETYVEGTLVYRSIARLNCTTDGPASVTISNEDHKLMAVGGGGTVGGAGGCDVYVNRQANSVVGTFTEWADLYWMPGEKLYPPLTMQPGQSVWVLGQDESGQYKQIQLSCQFLWVETGVIGPNYDSVWNGTPLPTTVVE